MLVLETVAKIRRAYFVQKKTIKAICRELRVSRKVVRKVLRSEATEFHYERGEQRLPRIGPWQAEPAQMHATEAGGAGSGAGVKRGQARPRTADADPDLRGTPRARLRRRLRRRAALCPGLAGRPRRDLGRRVHSAQFRPGRGLSVRLEP